MNTEKIFGIIIILLFLLYIISNIYLAKLSFTNLEEKKEYNRTEIVLARIAIIMTWIIIALFIYSIITALSANK